MDINKGQAGSSATFPPASSSAVAPVRATPAEMLRAAAALVAEATKALDQTFERCGCGGRRFTNLVEGRTAGRLKDIPTKLVRLAHGLETNDPEVE
jgi:hypothetical protein